RVEGEKGLRWRGVEAFRRMGTLPGKDAEVQVAVSACRGLLADAENYGQTTASGLGLVRLIEGRLEEMLGRGEAAVGHYLQAFELGERREGDVYRLLEQLRQRRQLTTADRVLRQCEQLGMTEAVTATRPE